MNLNEAAGYFDAGDSFYEFGCDKDDAEFYFNYIVKLKNIV